MTQRLPPRVNPAEPIKYETFRCDDCRTNGRTIRGSNVVVDHGIRWRVCDDCAKKRTAKLSGST